MQQHSLPRTRCARRTFILGLVVFGMTAPVSVKAQEITVSGVVVERSQLTPIRGAVIRLAGSSPATTDVDGRFRFDGVVPGRLTLSIEAFGYLRRSLELVIRADTIFQFELDPDPVVLDTMLVSPGNVTIKGIVRDSATGLKLLKGAQVTIYPEAKTVGAMSGSFTLRDLPRNRPIGLLIEALEYLPVRVEFMAAHDTTLDVAMSVDSVAVRMIAQQAKRLETRSHAIPYSIDALDRDDIHRSGVTSIGELIHRRLPKVIPDRPPYPSPEEVCVIYDDMPSRLEDLVGAPPELFERIEIFGYRGKMIRVYSKRYVATLMRVPRLAPITYMDAGRRNVCW